MMILMGGGANRSYWQTQGMARTLGVDLTGAVVEGWITRDELGAMVMNCQLCPRAEECSRWLARSGAGSAVLPGYCANKETLEALRPV